LIFPWIEEHEQYFKQPQKDLSEDLPHIEADGHGYGIDFVPNPAFQPVSRANFTVILAMADDGFNGVAPLHAFFYCRGDPALPARQNDLHILIFDAMAPMTKLLLVVVA